VTTSTHADEYRTITCVLKAVRKAAGLTQQEAADRLDKPQSYVDRLYGGERRIDIVEFIILARAKEIDPMKMFRKIVKQVGIGWKRRDRAIRVEPSALSDGGSCHGEDAPRWK
jgi:transcriptional regulator with XRE-family HTH domain